MPEYTVRVTYTYPVTAVDAKDALSTVPIAIQARFNNGEGLAEIIDDENDVVLQAKMVTSDFQKEMAKLKIKERG
ncbi:MAG: hypothetical protein V1771_05095 [Chloroflexota bacterium]